MVPVQPRPIQTPPAQAAPVSAASAQERRPSLAEDVLLAGQLDAGGGVDDVAGAAGASSEPVPVEAGKVCAAASGVDALTARVDVELAGAGPGASVGVRHRGRRCW